MTRMYIHISNRKKLRTHLNIVSRTKIFIKITNFIYDFNKSQTIEYINLNFKLIQFIIENHQNSRHFNYIN